MTTHHIIVTGKVQGVFFRATAKKIGLSLGLAGWVRNTSDGNVEIVVSGREEIVAEFEKWCRIGPPSAKIVEVIINSSEEESFTDFKILR